VEVLVQALDLADEDHGRTLLPDVSNAVLYEAALTVMMRLVVLHTVRERWLSPGPDAETIELQDWFILRC
jgi:hypothetical protein